MAGNKFTRILSGFLKERPQQALGVGLGVGLLGATALAIRYAFRPHRRPQMPESLSPAIFADRVLPTCHGQMVYHISGSGEPLVFLHGIYPGASSFEWSRLYPEFTMGWEVIAPDLIGFGESERPTRALDLREQAESLIEFLHVVCGDRRPTLVASGVGAKLALLLASQHPEFFRRLILWQPLGVRQALRGASARSAIGLARLPWLRSLAWAAQLSNPGFLKNWLAKVGFEEEGAEDDDAVRVISTCASLYQAQNAIWGFLKGGYSDDLSNRLAAISCAVTIFWPERSTRNPVIEAEKLAREIPGAALHTIPAAGLLAPLRHPAYFRELIEESLQSPFEDSHVA